jgi:dihydroflavonol-4-reductase
MLGHNLVRLLLEQGHEVRALVRSRSKANTLFRGLNLQVIEGDMDNVPAFAHAIEGVDAVFHTAAFFREYGQPGEHWSTLERINITATMELLEAAERASVKAFIHTSSGGTIGIKPGGDPGDEDTPADARQLRNEYFKSKVLGDTAIKRWLETPRQIKVVTILPGWMFGPRDAGPTGAGGLVLQFLNRELPGVMDAGGTIADPRDVAQTMLKAVNHGKHGERYIVAGRYASLENVFATLEHVSGVPAPRLRLPQGLLENLARLDGIRARLTRTESRLPLIPIQTLHLKRSITSAKAERELGATFRPLEETLRDTVQWFCDNGYVKSTSGVKLKSQRAQ